MADDLKTLITEMREAFGAMQTAAKQDNEALMNKAEEAYKAAKGAADALAAKDKQDKEFAAKLDQIEAALKTMEVEGVKGAGQALNEYDKAFTDALRKGEMVDAVALNQIAKRVYNQVAESTNAAGGYLVRPEMAQEVIGAVADYNIFRQVANVVTVGTNGYLVNAMPNGPTMNFGANDTSATGAGTPSPAFSQISIQVVDCDVTIPVTRDILMDAEFDLEGFLAREAAVAFGNGEMNAFTNGGGASASGARTIGGLFSATAAADGSSLPFGTVGTINSGAAAAISSVDPLFDMIAALKSVYRRNASWMASSSTISALRKLKKTSTNDGYLIWTPSLVAGEPDLLLNKPLHENDYAPAIAANAYPIAFGDFKRAYTIVDRQQMYLLVTVNASSKRVLDYTWLHRVGGGVTDSRAVKLLKVAANS